MRSSLTSLVLAAAAGFGCGHQRNADAVAPVQPNDPAPVTAAWRPPAPVPPTPTEVGVAPSACGFQPPALAAPANGATLSGATALSVPAARAASCNGAAGTVFKVINTQSLIVYSACVAVDPARTTWDTRQSPNGQYWITAQSACGCAPCAEYAFVEVAVRN